MNQQERKRVFISRIDEEKRAGSVLKEWIEDAFAGQVDVFVSDDPTNLAGGRRWLEVIEGELRNQNTVMLISILSPVSIERPWILMEFGGAWIRGMRVFPLCHSGLDKSSLQRPLGDFQGGSIDQAEIGSLIIGAVGSAVALAHSKKLDFARMRAELIAAIGAVAPARKVAKREVEDAELHPEELQILEILAHAKDQRSDAYLLGPQIASIANLKRTVCDLRLSNLVQKKLVHDSISMSEPTAYAILDKGVALLMERGRIK
jgi:hypothetical protein